MPIVEVKMLEGRPQEKKKEVIQAVTKAIIDTLGSKPESVRVLITEMPKNHYAVGGVLESEKG